MKHVTFTPQLDERNSELRLITRSLMLLALLTAILYIRVFVATMLSTLDAGGQAWIGYLSIVFLVVAMAGLILTWRWDGIGGLMTVISGIGLAISTYFINSDSPWLNAFFYSSPFIITGGLCLVCWYRTRDSQTAENEF